MNNIEKVKLSQEQADSIDYALNQGRYNHESLILSHAETELQDNPWTQAYKPLNEISLLTLVDALRVGYEVGELYKVGDWVYHAPSLKVSKVMRVGNAILGIDSCDVWSIENSRHATPKEIKVEKERRLWKSIGREVGEFKEGDIAFGKPNNVWQVVENISREWSLGNLSGFHPAESLVSFGGGDND